MVYRPRTLMERLELLRQYGADLSQWHGLSLNDYLASRTTHYAFERVLFLIAETVLDMLDHVLSARYEIVSDTYEEIILNAHRNGLISSNLYGCCADSADSVTSSRTSTWGCRMRPYMSIWSR